MPTLEQARAWYDPFDPVHGFEHVERVLRLVERIGVEEGADLDILRAAALLHDAVASPEDVDARSNHHHASAEFARRILLEESWPPERIERVVDCIVSHRFRDPGRPPHTLEAKVLFDADKLDAIGAIGAARAVAYAAQRGQPAYSEPSESFRQSGQAQVGEPHSAYHEYLFKLVHLPDLLHTPSARHLAAGRLEFLNQFFDRLRQESQGLT